MEIFSQVHVSRPNKFFRKKARKIPTYSIPLLMMSYAIAVCASGETRNVKAGQRYSATCVLHCAHNGGILEEKTSSFFL